MKVMSARDAKNHFGEFLDAARREPVVVTKNDRPVGIMISIEDAAGTLIQELIMEKEPGFDEWLFGKLTATMRKVNSGETFATSEYEARPPPPPPPPLPPPPPPPPLLPHPKDFGVGMGIFLPGGRARQAADRHLT